MIAILSAVLLYALGVNMGLDAYSKYMATAVEQETELSANESQAIGKLGLWLMALLWPLVELREIYGKVLSFGTNKED